MFRVSVKAVIENDCGEILCVKEAGSDWTLPGGGLDHGESIEEGLRRELHEEVALNKTVDFRYVPIGHDVMYIPSKEAWQLWVLFRLSFEDVPRFVKGRDADEIRFIDPKTFARSNQLAQQLIFKWLVTQNQG